jgi:hypothetical protein
MHPRWNTKLVRPPATRPKKSKWHHIGRILGWIVVAFLLGAFAAGFILVYEALRLTASRAASVPADFRRIELQDDAWYSAKAITRAFGGKHDDLPNVQCVRVLLHSGVLELHIKEDKVQIMCYCCFGGEPDQGLVSLEELRAKVLSLKDHYCPPWPG